ncbi:hypothetical protein BES08_06610 [Novosphingobium resinovorum]|uniref:Uncharacterized protein n=1 Tax=Novosphingobium resinovorum TaxID=158500 RepID=A0A1D8A2W1_9SPHN|nr:hypothetical protein BES08_06610 [Novosphingobium resinovorum]
MFAQATAVHLMALGRRHGLSDRAIAAIIDNVRAGLADWPEIAAQAGATFSMREIAERHAEVARTFG